MLWSEVLADKSLQDLPYKIELNEWGKIEMSPATNVHSFYQVEIIRILLRKKGEVRFFAPDGEIDQSGFGIKVKLT